MLVLVALVRERAEMKAAGTALLALSGVLVKPAFCCDSSYVFPNVTEDGACEHSPKCSTVSQQP
eukprot:COSAG02_NODE_3490_length_6660_cov_5.207285_4_plen_64_part_00